MATLLLAVAGAALGSAIGGAGIAATIGQAVGGVAGSLIDQSWLGGGGGTKLVEGPRLTESGGLASTEGAPIPRVYGRARIGGQLIWATRFEEEINTSVTRTRAGGKGGARSQRTIETTYAYYANVAIALCEGPISFVRRIWADGRELDLSGVAMRVHRGGPDQEPDPLIVAKEGGEAPAYRGTAYIVFERFPLGDYGNRVPQFAFEVTRAVDGLNAMIRAVTLIPGAGEFVYETRPVSHEPAHGETVSETRRQFHADNDIDASIGQLVALCPNLRRVALVVSWFGDDLRAGHCTIAPRVERADKPTIGAEWSAAGLGRASARMVSQIDGRPAYGGTPSDESVVRLIRRLRETYGLEVVLYPFVMMDVPPGNGLPDPHSGAGAQPSYPWRGRITCAPAPGRPGTVDGTSEAAGQVSALLGTAAAADFTLAGEAAVYAGPDEWSLRRMVLHHAMLAKAAGGVDGFVIGSEFVGLSRVRGAAGYPFVDGLVALADEVRSILPAPTRLTYAADWTEYGAHVRDGGAEVRFPLDPLWASPAIDAIGIDYYPPLSDWRDTPEHLDEAEAHGVADRDYLRRRLTAGEGFDWYYADDAARVAQERLPITDGAYGKPWIYRVKDLAGWWSNPHVERVGGVEAFSPTAFVPGAKPIWLTEIGIPAVDKGPNAPNLFPDPKSDAGGFPPFSTRARDDLVQARGLEAVISGFDPLQPGFEAFRNPVHETSGLRMVDPADVFVWTWDARPFPAFPDLAGIWSDGRNWETGHWLNGRLEGAPLDRLVATILRDFELPNADRLAIDGFVDGYVVDRPMSGRQVLEPLAESFGFDAMISGGRLVFEGRHGRVARTLGIDDLVRDRDGAAFELRRAQETELPRELRLSYSDSEADYRRAAAVSRRLTGSARRETSVETAIVTSAWQAALLADRRLQEIWAGRESVEFELSPHCLGLEPGDVVRLPEEAGARLVRLVRVADGTTRRVSARAVEPAIYRAAASPGPARTPRAPPAIPGRPAVIAMNLPIARSARPPLLSVAAYAAPWPGPLAIWRADEGGDFFFHGAVGAPAIVGETLTTLSPGPVWRLDEVSTVDVRLRGGLLYSVGTAAALAGANAVAFLDADGVAEIAVAATAELVAPGTVRLSRFVRGLGGSEAAASRSLPPGSRVVVLDGAQTTLSDDPGEIGRPRTYRIGPANLDPANASMAALVAGAGAQALLPLAPVHLRAHRTDEGIALGWVRRGRLDADSWDLAEIPLGEEAENYRVRICDADGVELRRYTSTVPELTYPTATEMADFGALRTVIDVAVAQVSALAGPGHECGRRLVVR